MSLAIRLKAAREKAGYSQIEVAEKLNVSRQAVSKWENGRTYPDIDNLLILSELYRVSTDELLKECPVEMKHEVESKIEGNNVTDEKRENFMFVIVTIISCMFPGIGIIVTIAVMIYCRVKKKNLPPIYKVVMLMCLIINIINAWSWMNGVWFHSGRATIEKVALMN